MKSHSEIDPYGEEEWDDNADLLNVGDIVVCVDDFAQLFLFLKVRQEYEVIDTMIMTKGFRIPVNFQYVKVRGDVNSIWWDAERFKKTKKNENGY